MLNLNYLQVEVLFPNLRKKRFHYFVILFFSHNYSSIRLSRHFTYFGWNYRLGHSLMNVLPGAAPLQWEQHQSIYDWELKAAVANQWRKYEYNFLRNHFLPFMFMDKRFEDVIRSFPLKINLR